VKYTILGKSADAIVIILDTLLALHGPGNVEVEIVCNIPNEKNPTLIHPTETENILVRECMADEWHDDGSPCIIGTMGKGRRVVFEDFRDRFSIEAGRYATLVHPSAVLPQMRTLGNGVHISPLSVVAPYAELGDFTLLKRRTSVGHHTILEPYVRLNPGANVAGYCRIGEGTMIGMGANVLEEITIGRGSIIGAGSVVTADVPDGVVAYGVPARVVGEVP
jgi:sugar O-acyltransferase (sialic acid O-acetyltransferase NeuD family)